MKSDVHVGRIPNAAVDLAVWGFVQRGVVEDRSGSAFWTVTAFVYRAANRAMYWRMVRVVIEAAEDDSPHPALQDFLRSAHSNAATRRR